MKRENFTFNLTDDEHVTDLAQSLAWHLPSLASSVDDIDESVVRQAIEGVVSDIYREAKKQ
ncbi:hypothetical protein ROLI_012420 [Roseobacter fucihabitans]|uniref:Phage protein n=1 Tax=Roseobacter fucihabitans TaxID=1537242 RepID=A0ABZ2BQA8_9RHOB|nr:hypothetical protein [Roseobacter litoralis]